MAFFDLSRDKGPVCAGDRAGSVVDATGQDCEVSQMSSSEYAQEVRAGRIPETAKAITAVHLIDRCGGSAPSSPWSIPKAS